MSKRRKPLCETVVCADGFTMSVQANRTAYSSPRNDIGPYETVEVGYPSQPEEIIAGYAEESEKQTNTVYPYVPSHLVSLVIAKHGGMISGEVPDGVAPLRSSYREEEKEE